MILVLLTTFTFLWTVDLGLNLSQHPRVRASKKHKNWSLDGKWLKTNRIGINNLIITLLSWHLAIQPLLIQTSRETVQFVNYPMYAKISEASGGFSCSDGLWCLFHLVNAQFTMKLIASNSSRQFLVGQLREQELINSLSPQGSQISRKIQDNQQRNKNRSVIVLDIAK